jgi:hypothetical protein
VDCLFDTRVPRNNQGVNARTTLTLAVAAGFFGGVLSQHVAPAPVLAQASTPATKEIRAERFVIVDERGVPRGAFGMDSKGEWPEIEIRDEKGHIERVRWNGVGLFGKGKAKVVPPQ